MKLHALLASIICLIPAMAAAQSVSSPEESIKRLHERQSAAEQKVREEIHEKQKTALPRENKTAGAGKTFILKEVILENNIHISEKEKQKVLAPFLNRPVGMNDINLIVRGLSACLLDKGYTASRIRIPVGQNISSGVLRLTVINAKIEKIIPAEDTFRNRLQISAAFPFFEGKELDASELDFGIERMNLLSSNSAVIKIEPGSETGLSVVKVENAPLGLLTIEPGIDNLGDKPDLLRLKMFASFDNLLSLNDIVTGEYTGPDHFSMDRNFNRTYTGSFFFPVGRWSFALTGSRTDYLQIIRGNTGSFRSSGVDVIRDMEINRLMFMSGQNRIKLRAGLALKNKRSYIEDVKLKTSSRRLTVARAGAEYSGFLLEGYLSVCGSIFRGLKLFSAEQNPADRKKDEPDSEFLKYEGSLFWNRTFHLWKIKPGFSTAVTGQFSPSSLYKSEKMALGNMRTVRGFSGTPLSGDRGFYARNEISVSDFSFISDFLRGLRIFAGVDAGRTCERAGRSANYGTGKGTIAGWCSGVSYSSPVISFSAAVSGKIAAPSFAGTEGLVWYMSASLPLTETYRMIRRM